jgi:uncharacterized protein GlcG (DUF336 family)
MGGLQGLTLVTSPPLGSVTQPSPFVGLGSALAAISKAGTAAYLSSQGNAFSTRTAGQIVQSHFNPLERGQPAGPLFGVQFSQLPCGDLVTAYPANQMTGPNRLPLGLSADPGGLPLFKPSTSPAGLSGSVPVGGVGVEFDGQYTLDPDLFDNQQSPEEQVAIAATRGFAAPGSRQADTISAGGRFLRFTDDEPVSANHAQPFDRLRGMLIDVPGFYEAATGPRSGAQLGTARSGILATTVFGLPAAVLVDPAGNVRFPPRSAATPGGLTEDEVAAILDNALGVIARTRAQIRQPLGTAAEVTVSVVGSGGEVLGQVRSIDAPIFGIDVSLQKARTAVFFSSQSSPSAGETIASAGSITYPDLTTSDFATYVTATQQLLRKPGVLDGAVAFSDRAIGNLSRPFFPDGIDGQPAGPLSKPAGQWSPFNTGLQLDVVFEALEDVLSTGAPVTTCNVHFPQAPNGLQIFAGSVPIYRGSQLIGSVGVSGDGTSQDDMIAFLSLAQAGTATGTIANAPKEIRADQLAVDGSFLRYVACPPQPFLDSDKQEACDGL